MTGAEMTLPSRTIAKYLPMFADVYCSKSLAPSSLSLKVTTRWPVWSAAIAAVESC